MTDKISKNYIPWIEKHRPKKIEDMMLDENMLFKFKKFINDKELPNIIISGIPGTGKTSTIRCIVDAFYGKYRNECVLELNAGTDRGMKSVATMTAFCKKKIDFNPDKNNKLYCDHKIIILDEADNIVTKSQNQINNLMEKYYKNTRFAFTCNYTPKINENIQSRCILMKYNKVPIISIALRLQKICDIEKVDYYDDSLNILAAISQGDLRNAINNLQLVYNACYEIRPMYIYSICNKPKIEKINEILDACKKKDFKVTIEKILAMNDDGFSEFDIILNMIFVINMDYSNLDENTKIIFLNHIHYSQFIMSKGFNTRLQLTSCISSIMLEL